MPSLMRAAALSLLISTAVPLAAQEMPAPKKHENSSWFLMVNVKFKPGKIEDAMRSSTSTSPPPAWPSA
jgi:hypothetical protein